MLSDSRLGNVYAYTYNKANRLKTVSFQGNLVGTYTYNGGEQLIQRVITNSGASRAGADDPRGYRASEKFAQCS
jgi:YD repeat-containing protein